MYTMDTVVNTPAEKCLSTKYVGCRLMVNCIMFARPWLITGLYYLNTLFELVILVPQTSQYWGYRCAALQVNGQDMVAHA